ncbi:2,3-dihydroxyphenylpropionate/2,3-dihydroxicinnamic acid 1,2-dioxygenase [Photorhabdus australis subsp. thailandensis]|uniref:2,3-dihydroxyphenylpropionate/2,3-dihydroxicinnamic acid 1,2-dioxygenase n=1 Tax=Photorhabdus australis subsp. thailandensis TaxID=2805096 RepID=A0A1C0TZB4_9GAMM|nr:3-carboxyethylcatechol 2,3-dioxygenase [Photorhabdus australis]OCQ51009.1 2,3-dihydroxyphenylpropionate/2,3-dihydroxicinnamic acid 1,2-dioxygenase [Photorhabdus australis subsp. thailandensis]
MTVKLICTSHTPLMDFCSPAGKIEKHARQVFQQLAEQVKEYDPQLIVIFAPDHFNGFFYDLMPAFCVGVRANAVEDWDIGKGPLNVPENTAKELISALYNAGIDVAQSWRMQVDHGFTQPLMLLCQDLQRYPTIPIFINCTAKPLPGCHRAVALGRAVGQFLSTTDQRVLLLGSGGLSHDPPMQQIEKAASPQIEEFLIAGRNPTKEARQKRQNRVIAVGEALVRGENVAVPLNPQWDDELLNTFCSGDIQRLASLTDEAIAIQGGKGGQEIRCWIAAFAALSVYGEYRAQRHYYQPIREWLAGMAMVSAQPVA